MYHPDVDPSPGALARMQAITQAYAVLRDPETRAAYDRARGAATARREATVTTASRTGPSAGVEGFARALVMMVLSGIILNFIFSALAGPGGRWMAVVVIGGLLLWKGGPIFRYFSGRG